jgi:hypothetical protein
LCKGGMSLVEILWLYRKNKSNIPRQYWTAYILSIYVFSSVVVSLESYTYQFQESF